jgi:hypothetical protein
MIFNSVQCSFSDEPAKCIESRAKLEALQEQKLYSSSINLKYCNENTDFPQKTVPGKIAISEYCVYVP